MNTHSPCAPHVIPNIGIHGPFRRQRKEKGKKSRATEIEENVRLRELSNASGSPYRAPVCTGKEGKKSRWREQAPRYRVYR